MVTVKLFGKEFPLCLTVAALDPIQKQCGGLNELLAYLGMGSDGKDTGLSLFEVGSHTAWLLGLLIREGEAARYEADRFGESSPHRAVPDENSIRHLLTLKSACGYRPAVLDAIMESMEQQIEAVYDSKNGKAGQG